MVLQTISRKSVLWPLHVGIVFWISLTFFYGSGDGSTKSHVASVCGPFVGHLTLLVFFLWPKGVVPLLVQHLLCLRPRDLPEKPPGGTHRHRVVSGGRATHTHAQARTHTLCLI